MKTRPEMQSFLEELLGNSNVYFQAPPNTGMHYPCIVFEFAGFNIDHADNKPYLVTGHWEITHIYKSIKNDLKEKLALEIPFCKFVRRDVVNGTYNDHYTIDK